MPIHDSISALCNMLDATVLYLDGGSVYCYCTRSVLALFYAVHNEHIGAVVLMQRKGEAESGRPRADDEDVDALRKRHDGG